MLLKLDGVTLGYDDRGRGTPLLLLHAFPLDRRMWEPVAERLTQRARLITVDCRGLGESSGISSIEGWADDSARLLARLGVERAVVGGLSMGGYSALAFARRHPNRLAGLLLADTRAGVDSDEARANRDKSIGRVAREGVRRYTEEMAAKLVAKESQAARDMAAAIGGAQTVTGIAGALAALRDRPDAAPGLAAIHVPCAVVVGALDTLTPPSEAQALKDAIPNATLTEIEGAGHLSAMEAPGAFAEAVEALLARL